MWAGITLAGISVVCFVVSGYLTRREIGTTPPEGRRTDDTKALPEGRPTRSAPVVDPVDAEMAEIEALLRKRGIT
jgi:hypothetical protein